MFKSTGASRISLSHKIYVYATFLAGPAPNLLEYDETVGTILIPTSVKSEVTFPPYSYPEPSFRLLAPQEVIEGIFREPISNQLSCKSLRQGRAHPTNPIVH